MKNIIIVANWKLYGNKNTIINLIVRLKNILDQLTRCCVIVAPPIVYLETVAYYLTDNCHISLCSQNVDIHLFGAFTGEVSAEMLKDLGVKYVIVGHSERRMYHQESNEYIAKKIFILKKTGLIPILCIGENRKEYNSKCTQKVCIDQISTIIQLLGVQVLENMIIAYEPIWAIGGGIDVPVEHIQRVHEFIREYIMQYDTSIANTVLIQYGGSVNSENVANLLNQKDIDGVLVGSASLDMDHFARIIRISDQYMMRMS